MHRFTLALLLLVFGLVAVADAAKPALWTCGMHPQIIRTEPGNCPICGMALTPVRANGPAQAEVHDHAIHVDAVTMQRMNLKTAVVSRGPVKREVRTVGSVAFNEDGLREVTTKYEGWIEKLFVGSTYTKIQPDDPLFEIYSPDLYNAELNYLVAHGSEGDAGGPLTRAALGRLQLFDVPETFIATLNTTGKAQRTLLYRASAVGTVIEKAVAAGQMIRAGERIYRLADLSSVWVLAQVYEQDLPFVRPGSTATVRVTYGPERSYAGEVALVLPQIDEQTRAAVARIVLPNPDGALRPGMYVDVRFEAQIADSAVLVPETAILRSGERNTVFVARDAGTFDPREVKLGARSSDGTYEVLAGLSAGERVVTSGQFMLDSESQLREAIDAMTTPGAVGAEEPKPGTGVPVAASPALRALAGATADAAAALAADDFAGYEKQRPAVNNALSAWLEAENGAAAERIAALPVAADLKAARQSFEPFSTAVTDLARAAHLDRAAGWHAFECPMPPSGHAKGRWLQRTAGTKNPFYGSAMPTCGDELR